MVVYRVGEYSRRAGGFAGGYRRVVDEFTGGAIFPCNLPTIITRLVTVKQSPRGAGAKYVYLRFGTIPVFDGYSTSDISNTDDRSSVGVIVTIVALICTIILVSFQRWVVRRTQSRGAG